MADDYNPRYRPDNSYGRQPAQNEQSNDPLAELARLIGQNDPFSEFGRDSRPAAPARDQGYAAEPHYPADPHYPAEPRYAAEPAPAAPAYPDPYQHQAPQPDWQQALAAPQPPREYDPFAPGHAAPPPAMPPAQYADHPYAAAPQSQQHDLDSVPFEQPRHHAAAAQDMRAGELQPADPAAFAQDGSLPAPHGDEFYDDAPSGRRRGLVTVAAVLGLAVVGTAGAFAYRSMFAPRGLTASPPVIHASAEPTKVAPPPAASKDSAPKITYDRFGTGGQNEQMAARQETPLDIQTLAARGSGPPTAPAVPPPASAAAMAAPATNPPSVLTEPRRVRTERIRPDQAEAAARPQAALPAASLPPPAPRQAAVAAAPPPPPPPAAEVRSEPVQAHQPPPRVRTRTPRAQHHATPPAANTPLSLNPNASAQLPPPSSGRELARSTGRMRVASVPSGGGGHGYLVQVSSQRSEADAQSAFRTLKAKFASVLGSRNVVVRRADLGAKGVYYRAMVGPFGSRDQAIKLCSSLKAAGGDCVVQSR